MNKLTVLSTILLAALLGYLVYYYLGISTLLLIVSGLFFLFGVFATTRIKEAIDTDTQGGVMFIAVVSQAVSMLLAYIAGVANGF